MRGCAAQSLRHAISCGFRGAFGALKRARTCIIFTESPPEQISPYKKIRPGGKKIPLQAGDFSSEDF
ncbi:MAG: hypothetical protein MR616_01340 [Pyramidobacter sp.]|nr:hypothetical protein [Pyramidobacter sp.]